MPAHRSTAPETTQSAIAPTPERVASVVTLRVVATPDVERRGTVVRLAEGRRLVLGRDPEDGLRLADPRLSRAHLALDVVRGKVTVTDLGSKNGTFVSGRPAPSTGSVEIPDGGVIRAGESVFVVRHGDAVDNHERLGLLGNAPAVVALRHQIRTVAKSRLSVLVLGPTGVGKEVVARAVHQASGRRGAFVAVNCAALPETLVESTLFGHRRGAFTHAVQDEPGAFARADGGTLLLDEVGDLALIAQPKLLRAVETGEVVPVGGTAGRKVDVRIVAATNRDLANDVAAGRFREDLYARLAGVIASPPPLAARREDVLELFSAFLPESLRSRPMSPDAAEALVLWSWPRNVRELEKVAQRLAVVEGEAARWELGHLDPTMQRAVLVRSAQPVTEADPEDAPDTARPESADALIALLAECDGNVSALAERVGRTRRQVYRWMDRLGVPRGAGR